MTAHAQTITPAAGPQTKLSNPQTLEALRYYEQIRDLHEHSGESAGTLIHRDAHKGAKGDVQRYNDLYAQFSRRYFTGKRIAGEGRYRIVWGDSRAACLHEIAAREAIVYGRSTEHGYCALVVYVPR